MPTISLEAALSDNQTLREDLVSKQDRIALLEQRLRECLTDSPIRTPRACQESTEAPELLADENPPGLTTVNPDSDTDKEDQKKRNSDDAVISLQRLHIASDKRNNRALRDLQTQVDALHSLANQLVIENLQLRAGTDTRTHRALEHLQSQVDALRAREQTQPLTTPPGDRNTPRQSPYNDDASSWECAMLRNLEPPTLIAPAAAVTNQVEQGEEDVMTGQQTRSLWINSGS